MAGDAEDGDGERVRLFVGQVPCSMAEEKILAVEAAMASCTAMDSAVPSGGRWLGPAGPDAAVADGAQWKHAAIAAPPAAGLLTEEGKREERKEKRRRKKSAADMWVPHNF
uniref:Uncharacterized protein n=1 Tax=Oryza meridionalis TaxID=40149 RepID=A0A0E0DS92_9ORYZ